MAKIRAVVVEGDRERGYKRVQVLFGANSFVEITENDVRRRVAAVIKDRPKTIGALRKYMRTVDTKAIESAYEGYANGLDRVPIPNDKAIQNTLEITYRIAPKLAGLDIKKYLYFGSIQRLRDEGFIDRLYK